MPNYNLLEIIADGRDIILNQPGVKFAVVAALTVTRRAWPKISVTRYELRACSPLGSFYKRRRLDGSNPRTIATTTSGCGVPKWMIAALHLLNWEASGPRL